MCAGAVDDFDESEPLMIPTAEALPILIVNELANTAQTAEKYMASVGRAQRSGRWRDAKDRRNLVD